METAFRLATRDTQTQKVCAISQLPISAAEEFPCAPASSNLHRLLGGGARGSAFAPPPPAGRLFLYRQMLSRAARSATSRWSSLAATLLSIRLCSTDTGGSSMPSRMRARNSRRNACATAEAFTVPFLTAWGSVCTQPLPPPSWSSPAERPETQHRCWNAAQRARSVRKRLCVFTEHSGLRHRFRERGRPVADGHEHPGIVVTHHEALEPPLIAEDLRQQAPLRACGHSVDRIICRQTRTLRLPVGLTGSLRGVYHEPSGWSFTEDPPNDMFVAGLQEHIA